MKTSELLRKAADEIRRRGWHQGDYGSDYSVPESCAVCSYGALYAARNGNPWLTRGTAEAAIALYRATRTDAPTGVVDWNDTKGRTVEEVLDAFNRAAELAEQDERAAVAAEPEGD